MNNLFALVLTVESPSGRLHVVEVKLFGNKESAEKAALIFAEKGYSHRASCPDRIYF